VEAAARVGAGSAITSVAWVAGRALALVTLILLARTLPAGDLGNLLAAIASGLLGATLAIGGLPDATARSGATPAGEGFGRGDVRAALVRFAATLPLVVALLVIISDGAEGLDWGLLSASVLLAITQGGTSIIAAVFRARGQAGRFALATGLVVAAGRTVVALVALVFDAGVDFVLWSFVALNAAMIVATWDVAVRRLPPTTSHDRGAGTLQLGGAVWAILGHLDVVIVGVLIGADAAGVYGASLRLAEFSIQFVIAVSVLYLPEAVKLFAADQRTALVGLYRIASRWSALISLLLAGSGFVAAPWLAELLLPKDAAASTEIMRILFAGYAAYGALGLAYLTSVAAGSFGQIRRAALVALPAIAVATVVATEEWGLTGAAWATAAGYIGFNLWWLRTAAATLGASPFDGPYLRGLLACAVSFAVGAALAAALDGMPPLLAVGVIGVGMSLTWWCLIIATAALTPTERRALRRSVAARRGRRGSPRRPVAPG
jgi:O-antigen/teichoic acid export membrane protein